jgi:hypothetical protein
MAAYLASVTVPGNEDSTTEAKLETSEQALSVDDSWSVRNGSLPVAVPTSSNQVGAGLHHVESSTTDSGVSNASSVTSDSVPPLMTTEEGLLTTAELRLGLREVEQALGDLNKDDTEKEEGREVGEEGGICSLSLESSDMRQEEGRGSTGDDTTPSLASFSLDTQSLNNFLPPPVRGEVAPDAVSLQGAPRRSSLGLGWTSPKGLRAVFSRTSKNKLSYVGSVDARSQRMLAASSTTGLILQGRPRTLPAKSAAEVKRHQKLYEEMVTAARRKELQKAKETIEKEKQRRQRDKMVTDSLLVWQKVLPNWENMKNSKRVRDLWWLGLPPGIRGEVWKRAIGNDLNISPELYQISLSRCREHLAAVHSRSRSDSSGSLRGINREQSVEVIHLDVLRTFPTLGFFQEGGPYNQMLHDVLGAYACYRPDVGYVQGMSFLAAVLLLNMDASDAFSCLANLLNRSSYLAFFRVDHGLMRPYFSAFTSLLQEHLPRLHEHFTRLEFSPEYYLIEWIFTMYTRTFPLDVACRVWDLFCRDGDCFLFRTALGVLRLFQNEVMERHTIEEVGQFLGHLPDSVDGDTLFQHISTINLTAKRFSQCLQQHSSSSSS